MLSWAPGPDPEACIQVVLSGFDISHGGPIQDLVWCEGPDTGSLNVPRALVERLPYGETPEVTEGFDWPHSTLTRYTGSTPGPEDSTAPDEGDLDVDLAVCVPDNGPFADVIDNPFLPFALGAIHVIEGLEGGEGFGHFEIEVLDETGQIAGVTTRVVEQRSWEDDVIVEIAKDHFAQGPDGTVCFFGEDIDEMSGDEVVGHDGSWRAGADGAEPGIAMPAAPAVGMIFTMISVPDAPPHDPLRTLPPGPPPHRRRARDPDLPSSCQIGRKPPTPEVYHRRRAVSYGRTGPFRCLCRHGSC